MEDQDDIEVIEDKEGMEDDKPNVEDMTNSSKPIRNAFKKRFGKKLEKKVPNLNVIAKAQMDAILAAKDLLKDIFEGSDETTKGLNESEKLQLLILKDIIENESLPMEERLKASEQIRKISESNMIIKDRHNNQTNYLKYVLVIALAGVVGIGAAKSKT